MTRGYDGVTVNGTRHDAVIFACHSDQALAALADATPLERDILGRLPYQPNEALLHTDRRALPRRRRAWGAWNYRIRREPDRDAPAAITYYMNALQTLPAAEPLCVTLNHGDDVAAEHVLARLVYHHPVYTRAGAAAQRRWGEISGADRTHFCGAYWGYGFHEDGVQSALAVCRGFGVAL